MMPAIDTKTALLNSAENAARRLGFDGFSYADLAEDVGIRKASIHHHFPSKAKLSVALMERYHTNFQAVCTEIEASFETGGAQLTELVRQYKAGSDDGRRLCLCASFSASRDSLPIEVVEKISQFRAMVTGWMAGAFEKGRKDGTISGVTRPALEASSMMSLLEGAQLAARAEENPALFDTATALLMARIST
jgi:TetR/AcrR family transcriptional repressor of nem operon